MKLSLHPRFTELTPRSADGLCPLGDLGLCIFQNLSELCSLGASAVKS